jgi:hypothetical protein
LVLLKTTRMSEPATPPPAASLPALVADEPVKAPTLTRPKSNALGRMASLVQKQVVQAKEKEKAEKGELADSNASKSDGLLSRMASIVKKQTELAKEKAAAGLQHRKRDSVGTGSCSHCHLWLSMVYSHRVCFRVCHR